jgi:hypothetical protein
VEFGEWLCREVIKAVPHRHLDLWDVKRKPPPRANAPPPEAFIISDDSPAPCVDDYLTDPDRSTLSFDPEALDGRLSTGYPAETYL